MMTSAQFLGLAATYSAESRRYAVASLLALSEAGLEATEVLDDHVADCIWIEEELIALADSAGAATAELAIRRRAAA